jgi:uncharacterized protein YcgI (DUF1989 family)
MNTIADILVPGYRGGAVPVAKGSLIRVTDVEGCQVGDLFALSRDDPREHLCTERTRAVLNRLFPRVGQPFYTNRYRPALTFITDHSPGIHDTLYAACDPGLYAFMGAGDGHPSCHANFLSAVGTLGLDITDVPGPVNLFQNTPVGPDGELIVGRSPTAPGDYVEFRAELDLFLVLTACSYDLDEIFIGGESTPLRLQVLEDR